jgi:hypothetical protein
MLLNLKRSVALKGRRTLMVTANGEKQREKVWLRIVIGQARSARTSNDHEETPGRKLMELRMQARIPGEVI